MYLTDAVPHEISRHGDACCRSAVAEAPDKAGTLEAEVRAWGKWRDEVKGQKFPLTMNTF